jgi:hypothetical protein
MKEKLLNRTKTRKMTGKGPKDLLKEEGKDADVCQKRLKNFIQKPENSLMRRAAMQTVYLLITNGWGIDC